MSLNICLMVFFYYFSLMKYNSQKNQSQNYRKLLVDKVSVVWHTLEKSWGGFPGEDLCQVPWLFFFVEKRSKTAIMSSYCMYDNYRKA